MTERTQQRDHNEIERLLPWFINNTLNDVEHERIQRHIACCEECRQNVALLSTVRSTLDQVTPTPIVPERRIDDLLQSIDTYDQELAKPGWMPHVALAASIGALALVVTFVMFNRQDEAASLPLFETATTERQPVAMDYVLSIQFEPGTGSSEHERVLKTLDATNIARATDEDSYRFVIRLPITSLEDLERYSAEVESIAEVRSVTVVALQLPARQEQ